MNNAAIKMQDEYDDYFAKVIPISTNCARIEKLRDHVLIYISPLNGYFTIENITKLIDWARNNFKNYHVFLPDRMTYYNFLAMGYSSSKSKYKTNQLSRNLKNRILQAFLNNNIASEEAARILIKESDLYSNPQYHAYHSLYQACLKKYEEDSQFRAECLETSELFLNNYTKDMNENDLNTAAQYLLAELPLYLDAPSILNVNSSLVIYHRIIKFFGDLYTKRHYELLSDNQGHLVVSFE